MAGGREIEVSMAAASAQDRVDDRARALDDCSGL